MPPRDELLPLNVMKRVMPRRPELDLPRESTLLEELTGGFYDRQAEENRQRLERNLGDQENNG